MRRVRDQSQDRQALGLGLVDINDSEWDVYFGPLRLGSLHERTYLTENVQGRHRRRNH